eukprot:s6685_g4.t1
MIELQGISAGQLSLVLTAYMPLETTTQNTPDIGVNAAAIAALQGQVAALPAAPDLAPYALASDLAAAEGSIAANASGLAAVNTSLTASQSALDALQVEVNGKSTPASVDLKLANHPTTAGMNTSIASANNATLATVAATYALKSVVDQLTLDVAARQTAGDIAQAVATALLPMASTSDLTAAVALRTTPADVSQLIATALLPYVQQTAVDAALALRDARLDGHDAEILALQSQGPFATSGDLTVLETSLQSAIDAILAQLTALSTGGASNLINAQAWPGNETDALLLPKASESWVLATLGGYYTVAEANGAITAALTNYPTTAQMAAAVAAAETAANDYTDAALVPYSTTVQMDAAIAAALVPYSTKAQRETAVATALLAYYTSAETDAAITAAVGAIDLSGYYTIAQTDAAILAALAPYYTSAQTDAAIAAAVGAVDLSGYYTSAQTDAAITAALVPVTLGNAPAWAGQTSWELLKGSNVLRNLAFEAPLSAQLQNNGDTLQVSVDLSDYVPFSGLQAPILNEINIALGDYWTQAETTIEIGNQISAAGLLTQAQGDARYFAVNANNSFESLVRTNGNGLFHVVQDQFTPHIIRSLLFRPPLTGTQILGNGSVIEIEAEPAGGHLQLAGLPASPPPASWRPRSSGGAPIVLRAIDSTLLASFTAAGITLDQDITVNAAKTLNATTADFAQLLAGSVAATGNVTTNGSILANQQIESDLRLRAPLLESDPAGFFLTLRGGTQGVLVDDTFRVNGAIAPEASLPFLSLWGGTSGVQVLSPLLEQIAVGPPGGTVGTVLRNVAPTGETTVLLDANNQAGLAELKVLSIGGCQLNALDPTISLNTSSGPANLLIEANTGGGSDGEVICFYGFQNLSGESLKTNLRAVGFVAQHVEASGALGKSLCKLKKRRPGLFQQLARDFNVRDPRKLFQIARREFPGRRDLTSARARAALRSDVARQILAPKPRSLGKSAAEGPNDRLQADLVDFSQNTRGANKYGLVVTDVFTREVATKALPDKRAETVTRAAAEIIPELAALPGGVVHRQKDPSDRNATAVVDRAIQTLKKDLAGKVARAGGGWGDHVDEAAEAYNARPHEAVTVAPEDVETMPAATFRVYQDNARKFKHNDELTRSRQRRLGEAGAFRAPTNAQRSFQPQYGAVREVSSYDSMMVRSTDGSETLLKHALPVPRGSAEPKAQLTRRPVPLAVRQLRPFNPGPTAPP